MDSLANYGSDDDYEETTEERKEGQRSLSPQKPMGNKDEDVNYEEVQMDLSEESDDSGDHPRQSGDRHSYKNDRREDHRYDKKSRREDDDRRSHSSRDDYYGRKDEKHRDKYRKDKSERDDRLKDDRKNDRYKDERKEDRYRERNGGKYREDNRRDSRRQRSTSREKQRSRSRSRSPRRSEYRRSTSKERNSKPGYSKRYDRASNKMAQLEKLGIEIKTPDYQFVTPSELQKSMEDQKRTKNETEKDRFFMPGITGRFRDQIERRKLLWQKKEPEKTEVPTPAAQTTSAAGASRSGKVWNAVNFAQDQDGKVASKFKRLMGIRGQGETGASGGTEVLKKQEEMFSSMEQQYEVARTATHTMRGVGLGFGSYQR